MQASEVTRAVAAAMAAASSVDLTVDNAIPLHDSTHAPEGVRDQNDPFVG
jgi:hypothetical protein